MRTHEGARASSKPLVPQSPRLGLGWCSSRAMRNSTQLVSKGTFRVGLLSSLDNRKVLMITQGFMWTVCGLSCAFLASRLLIRYLKKEKLKRSDIPLLLALPSLFAGSALLHSTLSTLYDHDDESSADQNKPRQFASAAPRLTAAIELLWIAIYCVKASFLLQFKFHKPPYSLVSASLTRSYWVTSAMCMAAFLCTLAVPPVMCQSSRMLVLFATSSTTRLTSIRLQVLSRGIIHYACLGDLFGHYRYCDRFSRFAA